MGGCWNLFTHEQDLLGLKLVLVGISLAEALKHSISVFGRRAHHIFLISGACSDHACLETPNLKLQRHYIVSYLLFIEVGALFHVLLNLYGFALDFRLDLVDLALDGFD